MNEPSAILSLVTLGVANLKRSIAFYETLGFRRKALAAEGVGFFQAGACAIAVFPSDELAKRRQHCVRRHGRKFSRCRAGLNCRSENDVDVVVRRAGRAGAVIRKPRAGCVLGRLQRLLLRSRRPSLGGRVQSALSLTEDGRLQLPD